jgi:hypothetical protein
MVSRGEGLSVLLTVPMFGLFSGLARSLLGSGSVLMGEPLAWQATFAGAAPPTATGAFSVS